MKFTHSLAFLFPDVRTCHGIPVNISLVFSPGPTLATELQGPSSAGVPGDLSVSRAGRAGGEGFPASLDHIPIYSLLPVPTHQSGPHYLMPAFQQDPRPTFSTMPPSYEVGPRRLPQPGSPPHSSLSPRHPLGSLWTSPSCSTVLEMPSSSVAPAAQSSGFLKGGADFS